MKNLIIGLVIAFITLGSLLGQEVSRKEFNQLQARVTALENKLQDKSSHQAKNVYQVLVNYDLPLEKAAKRGNYNWHNPDITSAHFPSKRTGTAAVVIEIKLFTKNISSKDAIVELDKMGLRPAEAHELCSLGEKYPELQREFPIVALGSVWRNFGGIRVVPVLDGNSGSRGLDLGWFEGDWSADYRFAAVRK